MIQGHHQQQKFQHQQQPNNHNINNNDNNININSQRYYIKQGHQYGLHQLCLSTQRGGMSTSATQAIALSPVLSTSLPSSCHLLITNPGLFHPPTPTALLPPLPSTSSTSSLLPLPTTLATPQATLTTRAQLPLSSQPLTTFWPYG